MQESDEIKWGLEQITESVTEQELSRPIENMSLPEVKEWLNRYDRELSVLEEANDLGVFRIMGGYPNTTQEIVNGKQAEEIINKINTPGSIYRQLINRFIELAEETLDKRDAKLRSMRLLYDLYMNDPYFNRLQERVQDAYKTRTLPVYNILPEGKPLPLRLAGQAMLKVGNSEKRKQIFIERRKLDDLELVLHDEIFYLTQLVADDDSPKAKQFTDFCQIMAAYSESGTIQDIEVMMRRFVNETKKIYNNLTMELISSELVEPWDISFLIREKNPFTKLEVSTDPYELLASGLDIMESVGYPEIIRELHNPENPRVKLDIEDRDGKRKGAGAATLGPFSNGKNLLYYDSEDYKATPLKRWTTFPHELSHVIQFYIMREQAEVSEHSILFKDSLTAAETISKFHELVAKDPLVFEQYLNVTGTDNDHLAKWNLFLMLNSLYSKIGLVLGELAMHRNVENARENFREAGRFVKRSIINPYEDEHISTSYAAIQHLHNHPGYDFSYFMGELNALALAQTVRRNHGTLLTDNTAPYIINNLMTGNSKPIQERVRLATGVTDVLDNAINYVKNEYARLHR